MGILSAKQLDAMREETRDGAAVLLEDFEHFREVSTKRETSRAELRRLCTDVRRLLMDQGIWKIAYPRIGKFQFMAPDYSVVYDIANKVKHVKFFGGANVHLFGAHLGPVFMFNAGTPPKGMTPERVNELLLEGRDMFPANRIPLNPERFLKQRVLCLDGNWITRGDAIKHIAYWGHGVHPSGNKITDADKTALAIRKACSYGPTEDGLRVQLFEKSSPYDLDISLHGKDDSEALNPGLSPVDPVLVELLSAALFMTNSPSMEQLEACIRKELSL